MAKRDKDQENKEATEKAQVEQQRRDGAKALDQERANEAAKTDDEKVAEEELAKQLREAAAQKESERVASEQRAADELRNRIEAAAREQAAQEAENEVPFKLPADARIVKAGTVVLLNGELCTCPVDLPLVIPGAAEEQQFASVLARDPGNFALNSDLLRLVYNPMNGTPLPLSSQRLSPEEMTHQERAVFGL
jgi:hypothetical protein